MKIHEQIQKSTWRSRGLYDSRYPERLDALEWLCKVYPAPHTIAPWRKFCHAAGISGEGPWGSVSFWNDQPGRTFEEVLEAFRKADV